MDVEASKIQQSLEVLEAADALVTCTHPPEHREPRHPDASVIWCGWCGAMHDLHRSTWTLPVGLRRFIGLQPGAVARALQVRP